MQNELLEWEAPNYAAATFPAPREFQETTHQKLREGRRNGHRCQVAESPTGSGKTYMGLRLVNEALIKGLSAIFACDRVTLIDQTSATADRYGLSAHGIIQANHWRTDKHARFQIASVQTLASRGWPDADLIVIDECHTQHKAWTEHIQTCRATVIGLSATPYSAGLGKLFTNHVTAATMHELTQSGVLVPMRVLSCTKPDMAGAETSGGEWTDQAAASRGMEIIGDVVVERQKHAPGRKGICFGGTIAHVNELTRNFNEAGDMAASITCETPPAERAALLAEYRKPDSAIRMLVSVEALAKGFDVPDVGCVLDCRPLRKSLSTAIQIWGRGLRSSPETGKEDCLLLDFSGNIIRFADDFSDIFYNGLESLDMGEKLDKAVRKDDERDPEGKECPKCGHKPCGKRCIACGHEVVKPSLIVHEAGEMREFTVGKAAVGNKLEVWEQCVTLCRGEGRAETAKGRAAHLFQSITGAFPRGLPDFEHTQNVPVSRAVANKSKANRIAFMKSRRAA